MSHVCSPRQSSAHSQFPNGKALGSHFLAQKSSNGSLSTSLNWLSVLQTGFSSMFPSFLVCTNVLLHSQATSYALQLSCTPIIFYPGSPCSSRLLSASSRPAGTSLLSTQAARHVCGDGSWNLGQHFLKHLSKP